MILVILQRLKKLWLRLALGAGGARYITSVWISSLLLLQPNIFTSNFEEGDFSKWRKELCCQHSVQIVSSPRAGEHAGLVKEKVTLFASSKRAEIEIRHCQNNGMASAIIT